MYVGAGTFYLTDIAGVQAIWGQLGFPAYLVPIMAVVKIVAGLVILWRPLVALTDLAYAGVFFHLLLAVSAHVNAGDGGFVPALVGTVLLIVSFFTQNAARTKPSPYGHLPLAA
jgi:hypothetical protein